LGEVRSTHPGLEGGRRHWRVINRLGRLVQRVKDDHVRWGGTGHEQKTSQGKYRPGQNAY